MTRKVRKIKEVKIERPERAKLTSEEILKRMEDFPKRKDEFVATVRASKSRSVSTRSA